MIPESTNHQEDLSKLPELQKAHAVFAKLLRSPANLLPHVGYSQIQIHIATPPLLLIQESGKMVHNNRQLPFIYFTDNDHGEARIEFLQTGQGYQLTAMTHSILILQMTLIFFSFLRRELSI